MNAKHLSLIVFLFLVMPMFSLAGTPGFVSMVSIPGIPNNSQDLGTYFNALYRISISVAALIAVVKIIGAGAKYMITDIVPTKGEALAEIKGAVLGLLVIIGAVLILNTINVKLTDTAIQYKPVTAPEPPKKPSTVSIDKANIRSVEEFCNVASQQNQHCVINRNIDAIDLNQLVNFDYISSSPEEARKFCENKTNAGGLNGYYYTAGLANVGNCAYTKESLSAYQKLEVQKNIDKACTDLDSGPCLTKTCESITDTTALRGYCSVCGELGGSEPNVNGARDGVCVIPKNKFGVINKQPNVTYYIDGEPNHGYIASEIVGNQSIDEKVLIKTHGYSGYEYIPCKQIKSHISQKADPDPVPLCQ